MSISVNNAILRKNNRRAGAICVTFRAGSVRFGIKKNGVNRIKSRDRV